MSGLSTHILSLFLIIFIHLLVSGSCLGLRCRGSLLALLLRLDLLIVEIFFLLLLLLLSSLRGLSSLCSCSQIVVLAVEIISVGASEDGATRLLSEIDPDRGVVYCGSAHNTIRCLSRDNVGNVLNTLIVEIEVTEV